MTQKGYNKAVITQPSTVQFVHECYKTQAIYDKTVK